MKVLSEKEPDSFLFRDSPLGLPIRHSDFKICVLEAHEHSSLFYD